MALDKQEQALKEQEATKQTVDEKKTGKEPKLPGTREYNIISALEEEIRILFKQAPGFKYALMGGTAVQAYLEPGLRRVSNDIDVYAAATEAQVSEWLGKKGYSKPEVLKFGDEIVVKGRKAVLKAGFPISVKVEAHLLTEQQLSEKEVREIVFSSKYSEHYGLETAKITALTPLELFLEKLNVISEGRIYVKDIYDCYFLSKIIDYKDFKKKFASSHFAKTTGGMDAFLSGAKFIIDNFHRTKWEGIHSQLRNLVPEKGFTQELWGKMLKELSGYLVRIGFKYVEPQAYRRVEMTLFEKYGDNELIELITIVTGTKPVSGRARHQYIKRLRAFLVKLSEESCSKLNEMLSKNTPKDAVKKIANSEFASKSLP